VLGRISSPASSPSLSTCNDERMCVIATDQPNSLSSPFMDATSACGFFDMILGLFIEADVASGKIVVLDEAHKVYLSSSSALRDV
jgi:hypothetical protein